LELLCLVDAPAGLAGDAEAGVVENEEELAAGFEGTESVF
jgi:hypothetical protein